jgi:hypothetical protein
VIAVSDAHFGESFEFEVEGESALDVLHVGLWVSEVI